MLATLTVCHLHIKVENNKNKQPYQLIKPKTSGGRQLTFTFFFFFFFGSSDKRQCSGDCITKVVKYLG